MKKIVATIGLLVSQSVFANPLPSTYWHDISEPEQQLKVLSNTDIKHDVLKRRTLLLDIEEFRDLLTGNSSLFSADALETKQAKEINPIEISLPLPSGRFERVKIFPSAILSPEIAQQYPAIKTWRVQGVDRPEVTGRLDITSTAFHGMLNMPDGDKVYIDPDNNNKLSSFYQSLSKFDNPARFKTDFNCQVHEDNHQPDIHPENKNLAGKKLAQTPIQDLITYRLAIAGTAEYTASQGGTPISAFESMVTTINRVNDIYQRDLGVKLEIVNGNNFAYTNASTDPYTNNNANNLIAQNITNINNNFGAANYDIGHVFAQGPLGGLAYVGATCHDNYKAGGATGITDPQGEIFSIEFVAHEMGHQLGATHTFNSETGACSVATRSPDTAVEPGSGSTIMSYTGLCGDDNIEINSDAMFHWVSIDQIKHYTRVEGGKSCGTRSSSGSQNPVSDAGADSVIPRNTPFLLDGSATGGVSYSWDQIDAGQASVVDDDRGDNAIIRSLLPSADQDRYIPRLSDLFAGAETLGELLPKTNRSLNFAFVVRGNNGGIDSDLKTITVRDTGSRFTVLSQASNETLTTGHAIDVSWLVAGTNSNPIHCSNVDIQLIRENGVKNILLASTDNDGSQQLIIPAATPVMTNARIMIACSSQPFFQISSGNITIEKGAVGNDTVAPVIRLIGESYIEVEKDTSYTDAGATATDNIDSIVSVVTSGSVNTAQTGSYTLTYTATDSSLNRSTEIRNVRVVKNSGDSAEAGTLGFWLLALGLIGFARKMRKG